MNIPNWLHRLLISQFGLKPIDNEELLSNYIPPLAAPPPPPPPIKIWYEDLVAIEQIRYVTSVQLYDVVIYLTCISIICLTVYLLFDKIVNLCKFIVYWFFFIYGFITFIRLEPIRLILRKIIDKIIN